MIHPEYPHTYRDVVIDLRIYLVTRALCIHGPIMFWSDVKFCAYKMTMPILRQQTDRKTWTMMSD